MIPEIIWYIIAALGAGVGTGLAGLSAATVMVPVLIVMCPSFSGETGAYQATAIALASDTLGSAVASYTYARNKNLDLRRGGIMLGCIVCMCTVGSYAAWLAGNVVLGGFTLFLTFCIGIRFLVKPDSSSDKAVKNGQPLDMKGILISLFFGVTIGFGTGFVGTGGGMMMLVVFTAFLGMELKTAVGTSTFIMTFTGLIASVSHMVIHPAIIAERWDVLLICIVTATAASRISAKFANRVSDRTVGLVTGAVLTVMGAVLIVLHYRDILSKTGLFLFVLDCMGRFIMFIVPCVVLIVIIHMTGKVPDYIFRKILHMVAFSCVTFLMIVCSDWRAVAITSVLLAAMIYPVLSLLEKEKWFSSLFVQKSRGEAKKSMLMLFIMFAVLISVSAGIFGKKYIAAASVLMWGPGDGMGAIIGIPFGRHKLIGKRSVEGTAANLITSFICGMLFFRLYCQFSPVSAAVTALAGAVAGAAAELFSSSEADTVTVPVTVMTVLLVLSFV